MNEIMDTALTAVIGGALGWIAHGGYARLIAAKLRRQHKAGFMYAYWCYENGQAPDRRMITGPVFLAGLNDGMARIVQAAPDDEKLKAMGVKFLKGEVE